MNHRVLLCDPAGHQGDPQQVTSCDPRLVTKMTHGGSQLTSESPSPFKKIYIIIIIIIYPWVRSTGKLMGQEFFI
jgi:hypothetical protein